MATNMTIQSWIEMLDPLAEDLANDCVSIEVELKGSEA